MALKPFSSLNLCAIFLFFPLIQANSSSASNETDLLSLIAIKGRIEGLGSWNRSLHFCKWQGITCGKRRRRVIQLNLYNQSLVGSIAPHIGNLSFLRLVNLSQNKLHGEIPLEFGQLRRLERLSIRANAFEGNIPANISRCSKHIDLAFNTLSGNIPAELGSLSKLAYLNLYANRLTGQIPHSLGSYGHVYKGMLNQDEMVAVKVFNLQQKGATKSFMDECKSLRTIRHRNLNRILTCCASVDHQGKDFKALVFEFIPNGSLEKWLYGDTGREVDQERKLNLLQRLNIAFDVASALTYLHHESHVCIIHRDLKLSNVLLDNDMVAHVSDFGLAKLLSGSLENSSKKRSSSVLIKGSIGYIAPEYGMGGEASIAGDVYSFGILLLELFIARKPTDSMFTDGLKLRTFAEMALQNNVMEVVDSVRSVVEEGREAQRAQACIAAVLRIGVACSAESPRERMSMENVLKALQHIKNNIVCIPREATTTGPL